jgi:hypothetical protein
MPTTVASGSGEPPERGDYDADQTLPRSGLLELLRAADAREAASCFAGSSRASGTEALVADPMVGDAAKDHVVVRGLRCARATR